MPVIPVFVDNFDVELPAYIRKIDSRARWEVEGDSIAERAQKVTESLFRGEVYSIWLVNSDTEFYGIVASLSANRTPRNQIIDFICITQKDLNEIGVEIEAIPEGDCLAVQKLHFNMRINNSTALGLCKKLIAEGRKAHRCKKYETTSILKHQASRGCKATENISARCTCEL